MKQIILAIILSVTFFFGKANDNINMDVFYSFITEWWKTPYKFGGDSKKGIDCSAFTMTFYKNVLHKYLPRTAKEQYKISKRIEKDNLDLGDLVFFRNNSKSGWHVGIYMYDGLFIHSGVKHGVFVNNLNDSYYKKVYYGAGRLV